MGGTTPTVRRVDTADRRSALADRLTEYHDWMERMVRSETDASYDATANVADDLRDVANPATACRAWIADRGHADAAGCGLLYGVSEDTAELKRLYVGPAHRGHGVGRTLTATLVDAARECGYGTLALTTPPWSHAAHALYDDLGFERTGPYPETRLPERHHDDAIFMQLDLSNRAERR